MSVQRPIGGAVIPEQFLAVRIHDPPVRPWQAGARRIHDIQFGAGAVAVVGQRLTYVRHGTILRLDTPRGLYEPSLARLGRGYFLTLRNDVRGYHSTGQDGLGFSSPRPWTFDDGAELGSYNTQQHWLTHSDGLFLVYTRRGASNDHIIRHRAPLFMAQVDPDTMQILRRTERVVVPERGAELGNFGAAAISQDESWVTVSEGLFMKDSRARGTEGATFVARIRWARPNHHFIQP